MRLWEAQPGASDLDEAILAFTVGEDVVLDRELLPYDCIGSLAHAHMLAAMRVLSQSELDNLQRALGKAHSLARRGELPIAAEQEDCHTALEVFLSARCGDAGKKIHTGRSRNDQVIVALRLLVRERLVDLGARTLAVSDRLASLANEHRRTVMPGYTHTRQAMPSTVGQLLGAAAEGLIRDLELFQPALAMASRSPLGSASGYGVPLPLDRDLVARLLGFDAVDVNTIYIQNTRGRLEMATLSALHGLTLTVGRLASDLLWFSSEAFGFFTLPEALTTGSSIMPQKRNPDLLELMRALPAAMLARYVEVAGLLHGLPAGYHRDLQRTKPPLLAGLREARDVVEIVQHAADGLRVNSERCEAALEDGIFATDHAYAKVRSGQPFREAYRQVKKEPPRALPTQELLAAREHIGAPGADSSERFRAAFAQAETALQPYGAGVACAAKLVEP